MNIYFWMESLMSSRMCTVIFLCDSDGPVSRTSLRLKMSPATSRKKTRKNTMAASPMNPRAPMGAHPQKVAERECGLVEDDVRGGRLEGRWTVRRLAGCLFDLTRGGLCA